MKSNAICPISDKRIDDHIARINGGITLALLVVFITTGSIVPVLFLFVDFALRSGNQSRFSGLSYISRSVVRVLSLKPELINAGPKIFAARIGLFFNFSIILFYLFGLDNLVYVFTGVFGFCAFLESFFGYCVACQIYPLVYKLFFHRKFQNLKV